MLYIRTDMNSEIATGHVMRCLSIADAAREIELETTFVLSDESGVPLILGRGFDTVVLDSDWRDLSDGMEKLLDILDSEKRDIVLVDSYSKSYDFLAAVREKAYVMYIDDINEEVHPVDGLLCYAPYYQKFRYEEIYPGVDLLLGTEYAPLRAEYARCAPKNISEQIQNILVLSGGSDHFKAIHRIVKRLADASDVDIYAICGRYSADYDALCSAYRDWENIHILRTVENLKEYMELCDVAVTAGGSTLYELCAVGTPAISYSFADNQLPNVRTLDELGIIPYAGDFRDTDVADRIVMELRKMQEGAVRRQFSEKMQGLVDGNGATRVASYLSQRSFK